MPIKKLVIYEMDVMHQKQTKIYKIVSPMEK